jgi:hypothetical protein
MKTEILNLKIQESFWFQDFARGRRVSGCASPSVIRKTVLVSVKIEKDLKATE